jgi:hypothetical protein
MPKGKTPITILEIKFCETCGNKLILKISRDIVRKKFCSRVCLGRSIAKAHKGEFEKNLNLGRTPEARARAAKTHSGSGHWHWIKDRTKLKHKRNNCSSRMNYEINKWRKDIFERDNYTCQHCFVRSGNLQAHHILSYAEYVDKRFDINNGLTLCVGCHKKEHKRLREKIYAECA